MQVCVVPDSRPSLNRVEKQPFRATNQMPNEYKDPASRVEHGLTVNITDKIGRFQGLKGRLDFAIHKGGSVPRRVACRPVGRLFSQS